MSEIKKDYYLYRHIIITTGEVFYIGISRSENYKRAYSNRSRSNFWNNIVKKYCDYEVQILTTNLTKEEACELETMLIQWYGRRDLKNGTLVNLTDGGDGVVKLSKESVEKIRQKNTGREGMKGDKNPMFGLLGENNPNFGSKRTPQQRKNISTSLKGKYSGKNNPMWGVRGKDNPNYGRKMSEENKEHLRNLFKGVPLSEETKKKLRGKRESVQRGNHPKAKLILCTETGIFYNCIKDASEATNLNYATLTNYLNPNSPNKNKSSFIKV